MLRRDHELKRQPSQGEITLSPASIENAAAESISNFLTLISWSLPILIIRSAISFLLIQSWWQRVIILISKLGRLACIIFQQLSVMTYSCHYKGVATWAVPPETHTGQHAGPSWKTRIDKHVSFRSALHIKLGRNYIARAILYASECLWPWITMVIRQLSGWDLGRTMFYTFSSPADDTFSKENRLTIKVFDDNTENELYSVLLQQLPITVVVLMQSGLTPTRMERLLFGGLIIIPAILGVIEPIVVIIGNDGLGLQTYLFIEQIITWVVKYYDPCDTFVNTKFDENIRNTNVYEGT